MRAGSISGNSRIPSSFPSPTRRRRWSRRRASPTHAVKEGRRYRYYVSRPLITASRAKLPDGFRIPAAEIERLATAAFQKLLSNPARLSEKLAAYFDSAPSARTAARIANRR